MTANRLSKQSLFIYSNTAIQNSISISAAMIDSATFDRQIAQIRERYQKLFQKSDQRDHSTTRKSEIQHPTLHTDNSTFKTPIKNSKIQYNQQFVSFRNLHQNPAVCKILQPENKNVEWGIQNTPDYQLTQRICLTSRKEISKPIEVSSKLEQKQKILVQRMKENERLLAKSKQLRSGESRNRSGLKLDKKADNNQQDRSIRFNIKANIQNIPQIHYKLSKSPSKEDALQSERIMRTQTKNTQMHTNYVKDEIIKKINIVTKHHDTLKRNTKDLIPQKDLNSIIPVTVGDKNTQQPKIDLSKKPQDLKTTSVFENTAKIQQRIRAILTFH